MADKNGPIDPRQEDLVVDPRAKEGDYQFGTVVHLGRQGVEVEWTPAAEAALAEARESFEMEDVEGYPVLGYVDADLDGGMYLVGLLIVAICGALMGAGLVLGIWILSS